MVNTGGWQGDGHAQEHHLVGELRARVRALLQRGGGMASVNGRGYD